jgi:uncharacterized flavoprotein (TIGR03862 family)
MAAERILHEYRDQNIPEIHIYDAMPSLGRKFLMAGKSGLNLTHGEDFNTFKTRYGQAQDIFTPLLQDFGPEQVKRWAASHNIDCFTGTSGRVFPTDFKAAPLLRSWLRALRSKGVRIHTRYRWIGWNKDEGLDFETMEGITTIKADAYLLALGGASWPKLGSDGAWVKLLGDKGVDIAPLKPSNCGFQVAWSNFFKDKFAGIPIKTTKLKLGSQSLKGEFVISSYGVEGSAIYQLSAPIRDAIEQNGQAQLTLDLAPDVTTEALTKKLSARRGPQSISTHIKRTTGLPAVKIALLREFNDKHIFASPEKLATAIKALTIPLLAPSPIENAISSAGGIKWDQLDQNMMLKQFPSLFCAGEMIDWDAPTGGYLLTGCFTLGQAAGLGMAKWLKGFT